MSVKQEWLEKVHRRPSVTDFKVGDTVVAKNGYSYILVCPVGGEYDPSFQPVFTPIEMLKMGVFEGKYLNDDIFEYPREFFIEAKVSLLRPNEKVNFFKIKSRSPTSDWIKYGWIHEQDPKGWFQWYCRYYMGRRTDDDARQIKRWKHFVRHAGQIRANCPGQLNKRVRQRQALLQWAHDPFI